MIDVFDLKGSVTLSPYKIIETNSTFERFDKLYESKVVCTRLRRLFKIILDKSGSAARNVPCTFHLTLLHTGRVAVMHVRTRVEFYSVG